MRHVTLRSLACAAAVAMVAAVVLWPVAGNRFINWDDVDQIAANPHFIPDVHWNQIARYVVGGNYTGSLYPVSYALLGALAQVGQTTDHATGMSALDPRVFHAASLALHAGSAVLVFLILRLLIRSDLAGAAGALLFAVHPVQVEPVAWVSGINTPLFALLSLAAVWLYLLAVQDQPERRWPRAGLYAAATVLFALALLAKPAAVVVPVIAALLDRLLTGRPWGRTIWPIAAWVLVSVPVVLLTRQLQGAEFVEPVPLWARPIVALDALAFYLGKLVWPFELMVDYGRSPRRLLAGTQVYWTWAVPVALAAVLWLLRRHRIVIVSAGVFVAGVLPVLGLVPFDVQEFSTVADRYLYLSMLGPALLVAWVVKRRPNGLVITLCAIVLAVLAARSHLRAGDWHDEFTLFGPEVRDNAASVVGHQVLGVTLAQLGRTDEAIAHYNAALLAHPRDPRTHYNLANLLVPQGRLEEAIVHYRLALRVSPDDPRVHNNLGVAMAQSGLLDAAASSFTEALRLNPGYADADRNLQRVLATIQESRSQRQELNATTRPRQ